MRPRSPTITFEPHKDHPQVLISHGKEVKATPSPFRFPSIAQEATFSEYSFATIRRILCDDDELNARDLVQAFSLFLSSGVIIRDKSHLRLIPFSLSVAPNGERKSACTSRCSRENKLSICSTEGKSSKPRTPKTTTLTRHSEPLTTASRHARPSKRLQCCCYFDFVTTLPVWKTRDRLL